MSKQRKSLIEHIVHTSALPETERWEQVLSTLEQSSTDIDLPDILELANILTALSPDVRKAPKRWIRAALAGHPPLWLQLVQTLDLRKMHLRDADLKLLVSIPLITQVMRIRLYMNQIQDAGAKALAQSPYLHNLTVLNATFNRIGPTGTAALAQTAYLPHLTQLYLGRNQLGDAGACALAQAPLMQQLRVLDVRDNNLTDVGKQALATSPFLQSCEVRFDMHL